MYQVDTMTYNIGIEIHDETSRCLFEKYGLTGNGYSWEGVIIQILEKEHPSLLNHIHFDPEAGAFFAFADSYKRQVEFAYIIHKVFTNALKLEQYLMNMNRSRIDD